MASEKIDRLGANALLYAYLKSLYKSVGSSSGALIRQAGPDMLEQLNLLGVKVEPTTEIIELEKNLSDLMQQLGFCDEMTFDKDGKTLNLHVKGCSFWELTQALKKSEIPPFGCPLAALTVTLVEANTDFRVRIKEITPEGERTDLITLELLDK